MKSQNLKIAAILQHNFNKLFLKNFFDILCI